MRGCPCDIDCALSASQVAADRRGDTMGRTSYSGLLGLCDDQVMRELVAGNADAFAVVFRRYHRLVYVTALRILRDVPEAEDVTQSVFLEIYRKAAQFDSARGTLKVWLLQFAYSRSTSRRNQLLARQVCLCDVPAGEGESIWSPVQLPAQEAVRLTSQLLGGLPDAQRQTITMFFFQGLSLKEIAERRNETFSNVRHHYYRGLERLREFLERGVQEKNSTGAVVTMGEIRRVET
jgi:RNA polymerase sigma-70 factor (ECF subfamily)